MATKTFKKYLKILNGLTPGKDHKYAKIYAYGLSKGNWFRATDVVTKKNKITDKIRIVLPKSKRKEIDLNTLQKDWR